MQLRWLSGLLAALFVVVLIGVPVLALRPADQPINSEPAQGAPVPEQPEAPQAVEQLTEEDEDGRGRCHGIQRAYWAVTLNPGRGEGKTEAAAELARVAGERGCELAESPPEGWRGGPPPWAGPKGDDTEGDSQGRRGPSWAREGDGRRGPPWASEGDGPPWGMAWGYWLSHGDENACARIQARLDAHPNAKVPEELRERLENELGCNLP